ncbi:MAG TPA: DUF58 domain-containing protein [Acidimicrobiales bacterium]|nr:DUF58 domain-containing protein [Acidimicrobiales bacterium]
MVSGRGLTLSVGAVVLALLGLRFGVEEFVLVAATLSVLLSAGAGVLGLRVRQARRRLTARMETPATASVGEAIAARLTLGNDSRRWLGPLAMSPPRWTVSYPGFRGSPWRGPAPSPAPPARRLPRRAGHLCWDIDLAPRDRWEGVVDLPTSGRGLWTLDVVELWCTDPLRLWCWPVPVPTRARFVVLPRPATAQPAGEVLPTRRSSDAGPPRLAPAASGSEDFAGLRPYVPGDRLARLHWPSVSRGGDLLVRQFVDESASGAVEIIIDTRSWRVEQAVAVAAADGLEALGRGARVTLRTSTGECCVVGPGPLARLELLRALAVVAPQSDHHSAVLRHLAPARRP